MGKLNELLIEASEIYAAKKGIDTDEAMRICRDDMSLSDLFYLVEESRRQEETGYLTVGEMKSILKDLDNDIEVAVVVDDIAGRLRFQNVKAIGKYSKDGRTTLHIYPGEFRVSNVDPTDHEEELYYQRKRQEESSNIHIM